MFNGHVNAVEGLVNGKDIGRNDRHLHIVALHAAQQFLRVAFDIRHRVHDRQTIGRIIVVDHEQHVAAPAFAVFGGERVSSKHVYLAVHFRHGT